MKVVVFGAEGQLGRELARARWPAHIEVVCPPERQADATDHHAVRTWLGTGQAGFAINAAAYTAVDKAESEPRAAFLVNRDAPLNLARACAESGIPLIHISTDYVFDGTKGSPYVEDDPVRPLGAYGESKAAGERAVRESLREHVIVRTSWLISAFGHNFVKSIVRLAAERDRLRIVADQYGRPTPAKQLAAALVAVVDAHARGESFSWGTYHFAGAGRASWYELAMRTVELQSQYTGRRPTVDPISTAEYPTPARRPANSELDTGKFERQFAFSPRPWQTGLEEIVGELFAATRHAP